MKTGWFLIANATQARLVRKEGGARLAVVKSFTHPQGRSKISALADDRAGHERSDRGPGGIAYSPRLDAKRKEHLRFARELADYLQAQARQHHFDSIEIFASSPFLGEIKAELAEAGAGLVTGAHDVDLTAVGIAELEKRISNELEAAEHRSRT